jgi:hypothetical protein
VHLEEIRHAADGIDAALLQVDAAVAVEIHRIGARAARHELRQADGAGVRAFDRKHIHPGGAREQQVLLELVAEEAGAWRVVEGKRSEGVDHPPVAGVAAVESLDADDGDDVFRRHAVFLLGPLQGIAVFLPELHAFVHAALGEQRRAVFLPGAYALGRAADRL